MHNIKILHNCTKCRVRRPQRADTTPIRNSDNNDISFNEERRCGSRFSDR